MKFPSIVTNVYCLGAIAFANVLCAPAALPR